MEQANEAAREELKNLDSPVLSERERQRRSILMIEFNSMPCPTCGFAVNVPVAKAAAVHFGGRHEYACACCGTGLQYVVPFIAPPHYLWRAVFSQDMLGVIQELNRKGYTVTGRKLRDEPERQDIKRPSPVGLQGLFLSELPSFPSGNLDFDFASLEKRLVDWMQDELKRETSGGKEKT